MAIFVENRHDFILSKCLDPERDHYTSKRNALMHCVCTAVVTANNLLTVTNLRKIV